MKPAVCVRVESTMKAKLQIIAKREGRSLADVFKAAALVYIEKHESKYGRIGPDEINQMELFDQKKRRE